MINYLIVDEIINRALIEDIPYGDITTNSIVSENSLATAKLICKEDGIICGLPIFNRVFELLGEVEFTPLVKEGEKVSKGMLLGTLNGSTLKILSGERVALNILQRLSGIATITNKYVKEVSGLNTKVLDTRKTTPGLRYIEKYAVKIGGGENHRFSLSDGILLKDNHIAYAGGIKEAINSARNSTSFVRKIEVEVETKEQVIEAIEAGADIIMLDNMTPEMVGDMVKLINKQTTIECSGNITLETIRAYAEAGVDYISSGALTHSVKALDISLKELTRIDSDNK
ncbi:carboxylating nicotinate-nucleotide diphosphorylase [Clostridium sp. NSJ-6]|uniref:nicotinate-nucleotide diphosphorylase (carboxylating) n=1 Tax=Clostridium hominis TaxID=2763036 RepID=A0ABR7DB83_9CLOT|nr:carboxylating nicotinate-nucleotide diphosphorylase [Clostridium hominis]MBC5628597.1 carboxylating nicotinate-nucleotide diphosphorylase [Clostridium hominis]MDU2670730.1 carboxylating nicotinate-nucleotide diphosphorylase [Clostridium sp.]